MKTRILFLAAALPALAACHDFSGETAGGELRWHFGPSVQEVYTRAASEMPDTNDFILTITDSKGRTLYEGAYGDSPESLSVPAGSYTVEAVSQRFTTPEYSRPQYGDRQVIVVPQGRSVSARLCCSLVNAGIRLRPDASFLEAFPGGVLYLKSGGTTLMHLYSEKRIAYFNPGPVDVVLYDSGKDETLFTRNLAAQEILTVKISASLGGSAQDIRISVDTAKVWKDESFIIGGGSGSDSAVDAISVADAASHVGEEGVWVYGYIVGGDLTSAGASVKTSGITKSTHLAIAARSSVTAKASCVAVELPKGSVRDGLNLVDHPDLVGTRVFIRGNLVENYFGTTGLKGCSDYVLK